MIFIGPELSDVDAHFVTNIVECIGTEDDLILDLYKIESREDIFEQIAMHLHTHDEHFVIYNAYEDENFFLLLKTKFPMLRLITFFSDDEWRHANYDRYLALYADVFTIAVKKHLPIYHGYGLEAFYMQWACNPARFYLLPDVEKKYDVTFIGAAYGKRIEYVRYLIKHGINMRVFGRGWDKMADFRASWGGFLSAKDMVKVINQSRVNLNFLWTSADHEISDAQSSARNSSNAFPVSNEDDDKSKRVDRHFMIKGRSLELPACRAFQLCNYMDDLDNYGFYDGDNIAVFHDQSDMLDKIQYYLKHEDEREMIAQHAYAHVLAHHTWQQRFQGIFDRLEGAPVSTIKTPRKYRVLVVVKASVRHQIDREDDKLDIQIIDSQQDWRGLLQGVDGVVRLSCDSTINNETLYMMAFGLVADKADLIASNFYVGEDSACSWIRFRDRLMETNRGLLSMLPMECLMYSRSYIAEYGEKCVTEVASRKTSYIEYPSFMIRLNYYQSRKLRLYFAHHRDPRNQLREHMQGLRLGKAFSLGLDKVWQKILLERNG